MVRLKHKTDVIAVVFGAFFLRKLLDGFVHEQILPLRWLFQKPQNMQQSRFTRPRRPHDGHKFARVDGQIYVSQHVAAPEASREGFREIFECKHLRKISLEKLINTNL